MTRRPGWILALALGLAAALVVPAGAARPDPARVYGAWRWIQSSGGLLGGRSTPEACRCERILLIRPDSTYEYVERDSAAGYLLGEGAVRIHAANGLRLPHGETPDLWIELERWWESWGPDMLIWFIGPDTIRMYPGGPDHGVDDALTHLFARARVSVADSLWAQRIRSPLRERPQRFDREPELPAQGEFVYYEEPPVPLTRVEPVYPPEAKEADLSGNVVLHVLVNKEGRVSAVKVIRGVSGLNDAAVAAVRQWVFTPAVSNRRPVAVWIEMTVHFPP